MLSLPDPQDDGLCIPEVKFHSRDKHHYLRRYMDGFTAAMRQKWELHYIDLFAGAGIERVEGLGLNWGSPLLAAMMPHQFQQLHLCERDRLKNEALVARLSRKEFQQPSSPQVFQRDANDICNDIVNIIPNRGTLCLAFLDPYGLHLNFSTVQALSQLPVDMVIFFSDHLDALRNWEEYYLDNERSNLDRFLGREDWRERMLGQPPATHADILRSLYEEQLRSLHFKWFDYIRIRSKSGRYLYRLIFATRHERGLQIWRNVSSKDADGQYDLPFN